MPFNKLKSLQNLLVLSAVTLVITVWSTVSFLAYRNNLLKKVSTKTKQSLLLSLNPSPIPTPNTYQISDSDTSGWKTYKNEEFGFSIGYPNSWYFDIDNKYPNYPAFYISKDVVTNYGECHKNTSCLIIIPSIGGRGDYMFEIKIVKKKYVSASFTGIRRDYFDASNNLYSSTILIDPNPERPNWPDALIDILPKIISERYVETRLPNTPENQFRMRRLEEAVVDKDGLIVLDQILYTFKFLD